MSSSELIDRYSRNLNYLRISITDRCNLKCIYCVPREQIPMLPHDEILRYEEILHLVGVGMSLGISKVRITGGGTAGQKRGLPLSEGIEPDGVKRPIPDNQWGLS